MTQLEIDALDQKHGHTFRGRSNRETAMDASRDRVRYINQWRHNKWFGDAVAKELYESMLEDLET